MIPQQIQPQMSLPRPAQGIAMSPKAARGPYAMRTQPEDDNTLKTSEGLQPVTPVQPYRIIPQNPPASVVVHKQYYQAAPLPSFTTNMIAPAPTPLRFNCALQPEGAQFIQSYGSPMLRNAPSGVFPYLSGEVMIPDGPSGRMAQGSLNTQGYYYGLQGRAAQPDEMMTSPYAYAADPWGGTTFVGEDGQLYKIDDSQARSAADGLYEQDYLRASSDNVDELRSKYYQQEEELKQRSDKLSQLQKQLKELKQRAAVDEEEKKKLNPSVNLPKEYAGPARDPASETDEPKKSEQNKNTKRHSNHHSKRR